MIGYQYIEDLFKAVLTQSKAIQGRFYIGHRYGLQDINYDTLGQAITDHLPSDKKWPLVMMAPPHSIGDIEGWEEFRIISFFMKRSEIEDVNTDTKMSHHTITQDWHDMKRCALNFLSALWSVQDATFGKKFRVPKHKFLVVPLSLVGADKVSGVRLDFDFKLYTGCFIEDYEEYPVDLILEDDSHPQHTL